MIGTKFARMLAAAAGITMGGAMNCMPDLGQQRTLSSRPGSGLVRSTGRPKPRAERDMAMRIKRLRKSVKRHRDAIRCWAGNPCRRGRLTDHCVGVGNGK